MYANVYEAKTNLSKFLELLDSNQEKEIIICNRNKPVARLVPIASKQKETRPFGVYKDRFTANPEDDFFGLDEEIASELLGE